MTRRTFFLIISFFVACLTTNAQNAQVKKSAQATFSLNTFRADGTLISASHGVFVSSNGDAIAQWKPFVGAAKAVVIDSKGKKYDVDGLIGASDLYDICKFHVKGTTDMAPVAKSMSEANAHLWLACYSVKAPRTVAATVSKLEKFSTSSSNQEYPYYILNTKAPEDAAFCPVINDAGEVVALLHSAKDNTANAVSALFASDMKVENFGDNTTTLTQSLIAPMIPSDYKEAQLFLVIAGQSRTGDSYKALVEQFINMFPEKEDGYQARARMRASAMDFQGAKADMEKVIALAEDKAEAHYAYSNLILDKEVYMPQVAFNDWNLDLALNEAKTAYATNDHPVYLQQQGRVLFAMTKYDEAYETYMKLQSTSMAGPETMFAATQCRQKANAPLEEVIALMDSTIAVCPQPLTFQSAPYVFRRGLIYQDSGQYRKAINDFNSYEKLMVGNPLPHEFFYNRFVCEKEARVYQLALNDIQKAIELAPTSLYYCELGSLQIRLKMNEEAIDAANKAIILDRKNADAYAILGAAQCLVGKKHEGLLNLEEAKSLGYEGADALISKYK